MHRSLTPGEVFYYNAVLRLPPSSDPNRYKIIVKQVLIYTFPFIHFFDCKHNMRASVVLILDGGA